MLELMGFELANLHLGVADRRSAIARERSEKQDFHEWGAGG